jgi:hypothetical protein
MVLIAIRRSDVGLTGGVVCWALDVVSGGGYRLVPEHVDVALKPLEEEARPLVEDAAEFSVVKQLDAILESGSSY